MPALRDKGTREVAMASALEIATFLNAHSDGKLAAPATSQSAPGWMTHASEADLQQFMQYGNKVWRATLGPSDVLYTPTSYVVLHKTHVGADVFGIKVSCLSPHDMRVIPFSLESLSQVGRGRLVSSSNTLNSI